MIPQEMIRKKRLGSIHTRAEMEAFFKGYLKNDVENYQVSAWLMAVMFQGLQRDECVFLTEIMRDSGAVLDFGDRSKVAVKHSTGGLGDKTSLLLLPLFVLEGLWVPMMAGRGLGHTGGTVDKLESVGWQTHLSPEKILSEVKKMGGVIVGQSDQMAPLDKRLYALRDVTDTVESIPLITASILSKKAAEGIGTLVMDVKTGSGAFMKDLNQARALGESLKAVGEKIGLQVKVLITDMNSPLGRFSGNRVEVKECCDILKGEPLGEDTWLLTKELAASLLEKVYGGSVKEWSEKMERHRATGRAFEMFCKLANAHGANRDWIEKGAFPEPSFRYSVCAKESGFVSEMDVRALGMAIVAMGGGRMKTTDPINGGVGLETFKKVSDPVSKGEPLVDVLLTDRNDGLLKHVVESLEKAYRIGSPVTKPPLIYESF